MQDEISDLGYCLSDRNVSSVDYPLLLEAEVLLGTHEHLRLWGGSAYGIDGTEIETLVDWSSLRCAVELLFSLNHYIIIAPNTIIKSRP